MHHNRVEFEPLTGSSLQLHRPEFRIAGGMLSFRSSHWRRFSLPTYSRIALSTVSIVRHFLNRAGLIVHPNDRATLDVGNNLMVRERFESICRGLAKAA